MNTVYSCSDSGEISRSLPWSSGLLCKVSERKKSSIVLSVWGRNHRTVFWATLAQQAHYREDVPTCSRSANPSLWASTLGLKRPVFSFMPARGGTMDCNWDQKDAMCLQPRTHTQRGCIPTHTRPAHPGQKLLCAILYLARALQFHHFWLNMGLQFSFLYGLK